MEGRSPPDPGQASQADSLPQPGKVRQAHLYARRKAAGLIQVAVWVPAGNRHEVYAVAERMRQSAGTLLATDARAGPRSGFEMRLSYRAA